MPLSAVFLPAKSSLFASVAVYVSRMAVPVPLPRWGRPLRDAHVERAVDLLNRDLAKHRL